MKNKVLITQVIMALFLSAIICAALQAVIFGTKSFNLEWLVLEVVK
tara:strand:+ start:357 stop:494 length:138 start_codon:yes stop_codon:yes gene_type:complete